MGAFTDRLAKSTKLLPINLHYYKERTIVIDKLGFYDQYIITANGFIIAHFVSEEGMLGYLGFLQHPACDYRKHFPKQIIDILETRSQLKQEITVYDKIQIEFLKNTIPFPIRIETYKQDCPGNDFLGRYQECVIMANGFIIAHFVSEKAMLSYLNFLKACDYKKHFSKCIIEILLQRAHLTMPSKDELKKVS